MFHTDTETERTHAVWLRDDIFDRLQNLGRTNVIAGIYRTQSADIVSGTLPFQLAKIDLVGNAKILKWAKQSFVQRLPEAKFDCDVPIKPAKNVPAISSFRCRRETDQ